MCTEILRATTLKFRVSGWLIGLVDIILKIELFDQRSYMIKPNGMLMEKQI
jgi:hypothetical protein